MFLHDAAFVKAFRKNNVAEVPTQVVFISLKKIYSNEKYWRAVLEINKEKRRKIFFANFHLLFLIRILQRL